MWSQRIEYFGWLNHKSLSLIRHHFGPPVRSYIRTLTLPNMHVLRSRIAVIKVASYLEVSNIVLKFVIMGVTSQIISIPLISKVVVPSL